MPKIAEAAPTGDAAPRRGTAPGGIGTPQLSGHCQVAQRAAEGTTIVINSTPEEQHRRCKGAVSNGVGTTWLCSCPCHDDALYCHRCGYDHATDPSGYLEDRRQCRDASECAQKIRDRQEWNRTHNPLIVQIEDIRRNVEAERADERARKAAERANERFTADPGPEAPDRPVAPKKGRTKGSPQRCHCGCGGMTKGGQFMMGHDMRLKGQLFRIARGEAPAERGQVRSAAIEIRARGWNEAGIDQSIWNELPTVDDYDPELTIRLAVEARYSDG